MTAFLYRMGAGFAGDVNRTHPATIEPCMMHASTPPTAYGAPVLVDTATNSVRAWLIGDGAVVLVYGITVRPYPYQPATATNFGSVGFGAGAPATSAIDVIREGYILVPVVGTPTKGGVVHIWTSASAAGHTLGGFEAADGGADTNDVANMYFNGPPDAAGICEVIIRMSP